MKEISGRKFMVVVLTSTYCSVIIGLVILTLLKITTVEVLLASFSGLGGMVLLINEWYFKREDRNGKAGEKPVEKVP